MSSCTYTQDLKQQIFENNDLHIQVMKDCSLSQPDWKFAAHSWALGQGPWACHRLGLFWRLESPACPAKIALDLLAVVTQQTQKDYPPGGG